MKNYVLLFILGILITSCSDRSFKQFEHAGGTFKFAIAHEPATLQARKVSDVYSSTLLNQVLEGLVSLDPKTLEPQPSLAKEWVVSEDGKKITFTLRDDVYFHPHEKIGDKRKFIPEDVIYSVELACTKVMGEDASAAYSAIYKNVLVGAREFYEGKADRISGLSKNEKGQIVMELINRDVNFINKLASTNAFIVLKELVEEGLESDLIGTGPFVFDKYMDNGGNTNIILKKNQNYYGTDPEGNQLPYLDSIVLIVESRSLRQLEMFEEGETMMIEGLPPSRISSMLEGRMEDFNSTPPKLFLIRKPILSTQYYQLNLLKEEFKDLRVRQALNYAVNRSEIVRNILNNQAYGIGDAGIVPPAAFDGYDSKSVKEVSYTYNPIKARELLTEAGYPNGEGFPAINLKFNVGTIHSAVADEFAKQMKKTLNINVNLDGIPFEEKLNDQRNANGDIFRTSWIADYYSPETFLMNAYGASVPDSEDEPSPMNHARYKNPEFDRAFEKGQSSTDIMERYKWFTEAEKIMMKDSPYIILWYEETIKIARSEVRNLELNEMNYYSFKNVYFKEWTKEEYEATLKK
ncbi:MAG: peptide ABC transporter substrate-binding protein [Brumimicrobium sp.]|nr:peptide ABC transporter substrate-binding protein [Brumimicrobium sp.]